uniref:Uncharacterized protein n=1 Tax=Graphocephala atropunctata TaxID=36148 RepID=A0A1B6MMJ1_9HEMI
MEEGNGLVNRMCAYCENCDKNDLYYTSEVCAKDNWFETNVRLFYGLRCWKMLCGMLNLPQPNTARRKYTPATLQCLKVVYDQPMKDAAETAIDGNEEGMENHENKDNITVA